MKEFIKLDKYGQLYIQKVLFESYFPIIFTCVNGNNDIFICVCCQNNEKGCKWLLGKTSSIYIAKMLQDKITIRQLLLEYSSGKISIDFVHGKYLVSYNNSDWNESSPYLPKTDSFICAEKGEFDDEINYFLSFDSVCYDAKCYRCVVEVFGELHMNLSVNTEKYMNQGKFNQVFEETFNSSEDCYNIEVVSCKSYCANAA